MFPVKGLLAKTALIETALWACILISLFVGEAQYALDPDKLWAFVALLVSGRLVLHTCRLGRRGREVFPGTFFLLLFATAGFDIACIRIVYAFASNAHLIALRPGQLVVLLPVLVLFVVIALFLSKCFFAACRAQLSSQKLPSRPDSRFYVSFVALFWIAWLLVALANIGSEPLRAVSFAASSIAARQEPRPPIAID